MGSELPSAYRDASRSTGSDYRGSAEDDDRGGRCPAAASRILLIGLVTEPISRHGWSAGAMLLVAICAALSNSPWSTPFTLPFSFSARPATNTHLTFCGWPLNTIWLIVRSEGAKLS